METANKEDIVCHASLFGKGIIYTYIRIYIYIFENISEILVQKVDVLDGRMIYWYLRERSLRVSFVFLFCSLVSFQCLEEPINPSLSNQKRSRITPSGDHMLILFCFLFQNLKNQIMTTNVWVEQVSKILSFSLCILNLS